MYFNKTHIFLLTVTIGNVDDIFTQRLLSRPFIY